MPAQYDYNPGLDLSALTSATLAQIVQAIAQITPLENIGGVIKQAGTSQAATIAQGTGGSPSVSDNPRFERYLWINTFAMPPVPYYYNSTSGNWTSVTIAAASVGPTQLAAHATILDHFFNDTAANAAQAGKILRFDSAGDLIEAVTLATILVANSVPLTAIDKSGAADFSVLAYRTSDGLAAFRALTGSFFGSGTIGLDKLATATDGYIMKMSGGAWTGVAPTSLLPTGSVNLDRLNNNNDSGGAPGAYQVPQRNAGNTVTEWTTPVFSRQETVDDVAVLGTVARVATFDFSFTVKMFRATVRCTTNDGSYVVGDEIELASVMLHDGVNNDQYPKGTQFVGTADGSIVSIGLTTGVTSLIVNHKTTGVVTVLDPADWTIRVRAYG